MKIIASFALVAAQLMAVAQPAFAAEIQGAAPVQAGAFGGVRLRIPLGGDARAQSPRLGLALTPTMHQLNDRGEARIRIGEGVEYGFVGRRPAPALSVAGRPIGDYRLRAAQDGDRNDDRLDTGEILLIAGGVVVLVLAAGAIWFVDAINDSSE